MEAKFTEQALSDLKKLDRVAQKQIVKKLKFYFDAPEPLSFAKKLTNFDDGNYRFRIGVYRIVFDLSENVIVILRIQHRRNVYRSR